MWDKYSEDKAPRADIGRIARLAVIVALGIIIFAIVSNQSVTLFMNITEFGKVLTKSLYYSALSGMILAAISLVRVNYASRHSMAWYGIKTLIGFLKRNEYDFKSKPIRYYEYEMSHLSFSLWQLTKVVLFAPLFANIMFGMTVDYMMHGNDIGMGSVANIFAMPFSDIPRDDGSYALKNVIPMFPGLTLIIPLILGAIGLRILLYVGISGAIRIVSQYVLDIRESKPRFLSYISTIEIIIGIIISWVGFTMFFDHSIDFNTRYAILATLALGAAFVIYGMIDRRRARVIIYPTRKHMYSRLLTVGAVIILAGVTMAINSSIADTKKVDWLGPYISQEIAVNRYMHDLENIVNYTLPQPPVAPLTTQQIQKVVNNNSQILNNIQLWDETDAKAKLDSQIASKNDIGYTDTNIVSFRNNMYWAASTTSKLPDNTPPGDQWFNQHMVYTHSDAGIKMVQANNGTIADESKFFPQEKIYYGASGNDGIFSRYWSAFPVDRTQSVELDHTFYNGSGGVNISPPLSWMFEPTFLLSDPGVTIHIMRYKEVHDRMDLLYPFFVYQFYSGGPPTNPDFQDIQVYPVTNGKDTYWLMPLIAPLDTSSVPWSLNTEPSYMLKLVGYALIDSYNGSVNVIVTGNDYFSNMFYDMYKDTGATRQIPDWLVNQIRYPEEMVTWRLFQFNIYHVTDPGEYLDGKNFYAFPQDSSKKESSVSSPSYVNAKPPGFEKPEFVAIQPLQFAQPKDLTSTNNNTNDLAGYMVVQNDPADLGKMTFYSLPADSPVKILGPADAQSTVEKSKEYTDIINMNKYNNPVRGDNVLYNIGGYEVYFNALFVNSGANKQIAKVAVVGAIPSAGSPPVGLGDTPARAFENYLQKLSGVAPSSSTSGNQQQPPSQTPPSPSSMPLAINGSGVNSTSNQTFASLNPDVQSRIQHLEKVFTDAGFKVTRPTAISAPVDFLEATAGYNGEADFAQVNVTIHSFLSKLAPSPGSQIYEWQKGTTTTTINFSILVQVKNGIVENHYISIEVG